MTALSHFLEKWQLSHLQKLAISPIAEVHKVFHQDRPAVLKLFTPLGLEEEKNGSAALRYFEGQGSVQLLAEAEGAQLLEWIEGPSLVSLVREGKDDAAALIFSEVFSMLHEERGDAPSGLPSLELKFASLFQCQALHAPLQKGAAIARELLSSPEPAIVLHGDLHHVNMLKHPARGWLAIDPKGVLGEASFDAANFLFNPRELPELVKSRARLERQVSLLVKALDLDRERFLAMAFAYGALSTCWHLEDGQSPNLTLAILENLEQLS